MPENQKKSQTQESGEAEVEGFRRDLGPFVVAAETTRMAMAFTDAREPGHPIVFANDSFLELTGYDRDEVMGDHLGVLLSPDADATARLAMEAAFEADSGGGSEICCQRKSGGEFWASLFVSPVRDEDGAIIQHFVSLVDLTKYKHEQAHSKMLIDELNHRVKNTLSTVQSIAWQALRHSSDPEVIRESIETRLQALSRSHDLLTRENWVGAGLLDLVNVALEPFGVSNAQSKRLAVSGSNIRLPPKAALALGIAFHELATNAMKYGALSNATGSITVAWTNEPAPQGNRIRLRWQEKNGPPVVAPTRKGFGSRVLERGLAHELEAKVQLEYPADGVVCTIDIATPRDGLNG